MVPRTCGAASRKRSSTRLGWLKASDYPAIVTAQVRTLNEGLLNTWKEKVLKSLDKIHELQELSDAAGRGHMAVAVNSWELNRAHIEALNRAGVERYAVALPIAEGADVLSFLKEYASLSREYAA